MPQLGDFYSEETQAILGKAPTWIIRWGTTIIFCIFLGILVGCYFVKYPDIVETPATISTMNPPADLISRHEGLIDSLYITDGEFVNAGELIAVIQNAANWNDIKKLTNNFSYVPELDINSYVSKSWIYDNYQLGELQPAFSTLQNDIRCYKDYVETNHLERKKQLLNQQIAKNKEYYQKLQQQRNYLMQDIAYTHRAVVRDSLLLSSEVISLANYEVSLQGLLAKQNSKAGFDATLAATELQIIQSEQQIIELSIQQQTDIAEFHRQIAGSLQQFQSQLSQWEQKYILRAPISGRISLMEFWSNGQHIKVGDKLASIIPVETTKVIGRLQIPSSGFGKVTIGQIVNVRLNGYPYMEYGVLRGSIHSLSAVPEQINALGESHIVYLAEVVFPNGMVTTYNKELPMIQQMDGTAEIITNDLRLIERFIQPIISLFKN